MKSCRFSLFLIVLISLVLYSVQLWAEGVYYTPEGLAIKKYSVPKLKKKEKKPSVTDEIQPKKNNIEQKTVTKEKTKPLLKKNVKKNKSFSSPEEAVTAGFKVGQTVMVKNGIIYKLAKDSKTGKFKFKRYRKVKRKPTQQNLKPSEAVAAGYIVGQTVMVRNGIIYKLAKDSKTGKYKYKRYRAAKPKPVQAKSKPPKTEVQKPLPPDPKSVKTEKIDTVVTDQAEAKAKKTEVVQPKTQKDEQSQKKIGDEEKVVEKTKSEPETVVKEKKEKQEQVRKDKTRKLENSRIANGRNMNRFSAAIAFRHSFLDRKTVITDRKLTQNDVTTTVTTDVGKEDTFFTDMHSDSLRFRLGLTDSIEMFLDAGFAYDKLSAISDMEPAFGFGIRYNITTIENGFFSGTYLAFTSEYLTGKLTSDYSSAGLKYSQETDWEDMTATFESGIVISKMTFYGGISYMLYTESISTKEIDSSPVTLLEEDLEQQTSINLSAGVEYNYSPNLNFQLEAQAPNRQGVIISAEYRF